MGERDERRTMTLLDLIALVVGFALAFSMISLPQVALRPRQALGRAWWNLPTWFAAFAEVPALGLPVVFSVAVVVLARRLRDGRPPRASEWLTLLGGLVLVVLAWDRPIYHPLGLGLLTIELLLCTLAAALLTGIGPRIGPRLRMVSILVLAGVFLARPATRAVLEVPQIIRFLFPPGRLRVVSALPYRRYDALLTALGLLPWGLAVGVPLAATLRSDRRLWGWTDWVGVTTVLLMLPSAVVLFVLSAYLWEWEPVVLCLYFVTVVLGSLAMGWGLGPWWGRRLGATAVEPVGRSEV